MADIIGDNSSETLPGTNAPDTIQGLGGTDVITGLDGVDTISGGDGADDIDGGDGNDTIYGHSVADLDPNSGVIEATLLANVGFGAVFVTPAPGDDGYVYALAKDTGVVTRIDISTGAATTFLDIPNTEFTAGGEQGVLGLAFHPDYETNGRFFVYLVNEAGDCEIREYQRQPGDPPTADPVYVQTIITIPHPVNGNHNGGSICFGPDGNLYVAVGDGGSGNDPLNNAQNLDVLLGKILRIDVDGDDFAGDPDRNYAIPPDNPFAGAVEGADEIWAYGLRNPWRISFDPLTGDLYIGDVGQSMREEVNFEPAGSDGGINYGWKLREGTLPGPGWPPSGPVDLTDPVYDYDHVVGRSITGGYVYRGPAPGLEGAYFFADFVTSRLFTLRVVDGVAEDAIDRTDQVVGADVSSISSFGTDGDGNLYAVSISGEIYRLDPSAGAGDGADTIDGGIGDDQIYGGACNDVLDGGADADAIRGGIGDDQIAGGAGLDVLDGQNGIDTASYADKSAAVVVTLNGASDAIVTVGGIAEDTIRNVENLTGGSGNDSLTGDALANRLDGGPGADTLGGGAGNDTFVLDNAGDRIIEPTSAGIDTVQSSLTHMLADNLENLTLTGGAAVTGAGNELDNVILGNVAANLLYGSGGSDVLNGGGAADTMKGGLGNDTYVVDNAGDLVGEIAGGGIDTLQSSVTRALPDNVENLTLTGAAAISGTGNGLENTIGGNTVANVLSGLGGNDTLTDPGGNDRLDGGTGADSMTGGTGNDTYVVDAAGDATVEVGGGGTDIVLSTVTWVLAPNVENLALNGAAVIDGAGNELANTISGNSAANVLSGGGGNDTLTGFGGNDRLDGAAGTDSMAGGAGNDTYTVGSAGDTIHEDGGAGTDLVQSTVSFALPANVETLALNGTSAINGTGNAGANTLLGNSSANRLDGNGGNDTMTGFGGADVFVFDDGDGADTIADFQNGSDRCDLTAVAGVDDFGDLTLTDTGSDVEVDYGTGSFVLANVANINDIDAGDFVFA